MSVPARIQNLLPAMPSMPSMPSMSMPSMSIPSMPSIPFPSLMTETMSSILNNLWSVNQLWSGVYKKYIPAVPGVPGLLRLFPRQAGPREIRNYLYIGNPEVDGTTFFYDDTLPSLPLPELKDTLGAYLDSCRAHLTDTELEELRAKLAEFEAGLGAELHGMLREKADSSRNWLEKWWEEEVYLKLRLPLIPYLYMCAEGPKPREFTEDFDLAPLSLCLHYTVKFWHLMRQGKIKPQRQLRKDGDRSKAKPLTMHQFRRFYNTARVPKPGMDEIVSYFTTEEEAGPNVPANMIVMYRGYVYSVDVAHPESGEIMTPVDIERAVSWIVADARGRMPTIGPSIPALTCDDRDKWAANRARLIEIDPKNAELLHRIESSMFGWSLQDDMPANESDLLEKLISDGVRDRWADKSFSCVQYRNGYTGNTSDHTPIDAMVNATIAHYVTMSFSALNGKWPAERVSRRVWADPERLDFVIDERIEEDVARIVRENKMLFSLINCKLTHFPEFGKGVLKVYGTHPDAFVQAAIQLAYYRLHRKPGSAYETGTTRQFYHGRTETCRTCSHECAEFAKAMDDPSVEEAQKWMLLKKALDKHQELMRKAQSNMGCDRHLFGLQMTAKENGVMDPSLLDLFGEGPWTKSGGNGQFKLSTSLLGYTPMTGGMVAMCQDGYGFFYSIEEDKIHYTVTNWVGGGTDHEELARIFEDSMLEMERLAAAHYNLGLK